MTRGKHGIAAETRRKIESVETSIEVYQRKLRDLIAENRELRARLDAKDERHAREIRALRVQVDEGVSPALRVAQEEARQQRDRAQAAEQRLAHTMRRRSGEFNALMTHFYREHGMRLNDASEHLVKMVPGWADLGAAMFPHPSDEGGDSRDFVDLEPEIRRQVINGRLSEDQAIAIQRARGTRGKGKGAR